MLNTTIFGKVILIQTMGCNSVQTKIPAQAVAVVDLWGQQIML